MSVPIAMIAAVAENGVIGNGNAIPWRLPSDFAHFKRMTLGKPLVMGRKTFESIGRVLPGRTNIIVSRQADYAVEGAVVAASLSAGLERAQSVAEADGAAEVMIGGGGAIYAACMQQAERLYISYVALNPVGDAYFPAIRPEEWREAGEMQVPARPEDSAAFRVRIYERR